MSAEVGSRRLWRVATPVAAVLVAGVACRAPVVPDGGVPAPLAPRNALEVDLLAYPRVLAWVQAEVTVDYWTDPTPMGAGWPTPAVGLPGRLIVDDECGDGFCWASRSFPAGGPFTAVHEAAHAYGTPVWFEPGVDAFTRGERWAQCAAEWVTGVESGASEPVWAYWDCPPEQVRAAGLELRLVWG